jgi:homoserine kinase
MTSPKYKSVTAFAPATVANVACAFDVLGFAVESPGDQVTVSISSQAGVRVKDIQGDGGKLPLENHKNTAAVAVLEALKLIGIKEANLEISIKKMMPLGSGLGSSAASAVAGALAVNHLYGSPLSREQLLPAVIEGERIACGAAHADNAAPSLLGGFILIRSYDPLDTIKISSPAQLFASIVHPNIEIRTEDARKILKKEIPLKNAIIQWGNTAGLIAGLLTSDYSLIGRSLQDVVIEPERGMLIPSFQQVKAAALNAGALGCSISGSGPSIFSLSKSKDLAALVAKAMTKAFEAIDISSESYVSAVNQQGAIIVNEL